jgi:hypothetical protein
MTQATGVRWHPQLLGLIGITAGLQLSGSVQANTSGVPALYATKAEAEVAAKKHFNCTGAHQMGKQWMPCSTHGDADSHTQQKP